jgi:hypothetical protein
MASGISIALVMVALRHSAVTASAGVSRPLASEAASPNAGGLSSSSPAVVVVSETAAPRRVRARRWLELDPIEKWTCMLDVAANVNTLLDDDIWQPTVAVPAAVAAAAAASSNSLTKRAARALRWSSRRREPRAERSDSARGDGAAGGADDDDPAWHTPIAARLPETIEDREFGAPAANAEVRAALRTQLRTMLRRRGIPRERLAPTVMGWAQWLRSAMDTHETVSRSFQPWVTNARQWQVVVAVAFPRKFCELVVDRNTSGQLVLGDQSAEQIRQEDIVAGVDVIDAVDAFPALQVTTTTTKSTTTTTTTTASPTALVSEGDFAAFQRAVELLFAHIGTSLFIESRAARAFVGDPLAALLMRVVFQHMLERNECIEIIDVASDTAANERASQLQRMQTAMASAAAVKVVRHPRTELSSWILAGTDPAYAADMALSVTTREPRASSDGDGGGGDDPVVVVAPSLAGLSPADVFSRMSPRLQRLTLLASASRPDVVFYDESAFMVADAMQRVLHGDRAFAATASSSPAASDGSRRARAATRIRFVPIKRIASCWHDHATTPYVTFFGPPAWEKSFDFRKRFVADISPKMGITFHSKSAVARLAASAHKAPAVEGTSAAGSLGPGATAAGAGGGEPSQGAASGRRRRGVAGLLPQARASSICAAPSRAANSDVDAASAAFDAAAASIPIASSGAGGAALEHALAFAVAGFNVDAKMCSRAFPAMRTPCGAGNSLRYRSVARSVMRRGLDEALGPAVAQRVAASASSLRPRSVGLLDDPIVAFPQRGPEAPPLDTQCLDDVVALPLRSVAVSAAPSLLLQERATKYITGRAKPYEAVPVLAGMLGF